MQISYPNCNALKTVFSVSSYIFQAQGEKGWETVKYSSQCNTDMFILPSLLGSLLLHMMKRDTSPFF